MKKIANKKTARPNRGKVAKVAERDYSILGNDIENLRLEFATWDLLLRGNVEARKHLPKGKA